MNAIAKKLLIKPDTTWLFLNVPEDYLAFLEPLPEGVKTHFEFSVKTDGIQLFVKNKAELEESLKLIEPVLKEDIIFWVTYPKKSSGIETDLEMMGSWDEPSKYGLRPVTSAAINNVWTALRFRPEGKAKISPAGNSEIKKNEYAEFIDVDNKTVTLPPDVMEALQQYPAASATFTGLAYTHKKEYVVWILSAKQEKTRIARVEKMAQMLLNGKKNPSEK